MKKIIGVAMCLVLILNLVTGCSQGRLSEEVEKNEEENFETKVENNLKQGDSISLDGLWQGILSDFESEAHEWVPRIGSETLTIVPIGHESNSSVEISNRSESYEGIKIPLLNKMVADQSYEIQAWVYQESGGMEEVAMTMEKNEGSPTYTRLGGAQVESGSWTVINATYTYVPNGEVAELSLYFEAANATMTFNIDDVRIKPLEPVALMEVDTLLEPIYKRYEEHFSVGVAIGDQFIKDSRMKELMSHHFNSITAENSMKPEPLMDESSRGRVNFLVADQYKAFGQKIGGLRGHALVWHNQTPDWFFKEGFEDDGALVSRELMLERMDAYIEEVLNRYGDISSVYAWDVVNEAIEAGEDDYMRRSLWYEVVGADFVEKAFESARKHTEGSGVKLFYNDYSVVSDRNKRQAIFDLCKPLLDKGLIDGIGLQSHVNIFGPSAEEFEETIRLFGDAGFEVQITELDVSIYENDGEVFTEVPEERLIRQAYKYKELFEVFVKNSDVISNVTLWGLVDTQSWLNYFPVTRNNWPLLFDGDFQAKLAYDGIMNPEKLPEDVNLVIFREPALETVAKRGTVIVDGRLKTLWEDAATIEVNELLLGKTGATATARAMYDDQYLYVLVEVKDMTLSSTSENPWEQDSVEIFIDEDMARSNVYLSDDLQCRVNYENVVTLNGQVDVEQVISATSLTETGYIVEVAIPFALGSKEVGQQIGFDIQVNDDQGQGLRASFSKWNDLTDNGWRSTEGFGTLTFN